MELSEINQRIAKIVRGLLDPEQAYSAIADDFVLGDEGSFDSVLALRLVVALEQEFAITVDDQDVIPENFRDLRALTRFVENKVAGLRLQGG